METQLELEKSEEVRAGSFLIPPPIILVVDTIGDAYDLLSLIFERTNHDYRLIKSPLGQEAIEQAKSTRPNLIILDIGKGSRWETEGRAVLDTLNQDALTQDIPTIVLAERDLSDEWAISTNSHRLHALLWQDPVGLVHCVESCLR